MSDRADQTASEQTLAGGGSAFDSALIARAMERLRSAARRRLLVERGAGLLAAGVAAVIGAVVLDFLFRLPVAMRGVMWVGGLGLLAAGVARVVGPAWRFRPSLVEVALRVEHSEEAARSGLRGRLASALELGSKTMGEGGQSPEMSAALVSDSLARFRAINVSGATLLSSSRAQRGMAGLAISLLPVLAAFWLVPQHARIGLSRTLTPWTDAAWPKRTAVLSATSVAAHPLDTPLNLRAIVTRSNLRAGRTDVTAVYRFTVDGVAGPETRILLNPVKGAEGAAEADAYEAALSRDALRLAAGVGAEGGERDQRPRVLEFWFKTRDDETAVERIALVERPRITRVSATVTPPTYAQGSSVVASGESDVSLDAERRGTLGPVLAGSTVSLTAELNKGVPTPGAEGVKGESDVSLTLEAWVAATLGTTKVPEGARWELSAERWKLTWTATGTQELSLRPIDAYDIPAAESTSVAVTVAADAPPGATVVEPASDEDVLASAVLPLTGEGRDDVMLALLSLDAQRHSPPSGSAGAAPEPVGEPAVLAEVVKPAIPVAKEGVPARPVASVKTEIDLGAMTLLPGDEVWVTAVATDGYDAGDGTGHGPVRSTPRKLRIISEAQLAEQILDELAALKSVAERIDQDQVSIAERTRRASAADPEGKERGKVRELAREQREIADRLSPAREMLERAGARAERNGLSDQSLRSLVEQASDLVSKAAEAAERASEGVERAGETPAESPVPAQTAEEIKKEQDEVRESMGDLNELLTQGRDGWAARQSVDRMLTEQRDLMEQAKRVGARTEGKTANELDAQERADLEQLARAQEELARKARQAAEDLAERAERLKPSDPAMSEAMKRAAEQALREQLSERMQEASRQTRENQTGRAEQNQEEAAETLEEMLKELDRAQQRRDEALQRMLADLKASIDGLIAMQERQLEALSKADDGTPGGSLAGGMRTLHGNTLGVIDSNEAREAAEVVARLESAAEHQETAATNLGEPADLAAADEHERMSLKRLSEAREIAAAQQEQARERDQTRKRAELRGEYARILETQEKLRADSLPLVGKEVGRRERNTIKALGTRQAEVRDQLRTLRDATEGLSNSTMFEFAHRRLDRATDGAATTLEGGEAPAKVARQQTEAVDVLRSVLNALKQGEPPKNEFRQQQGGRQPQGERPPGQQQQEQQEPGVIPPVAELLVLKEMQIEAARRTRETAAAPDASEIEAIGELQRELADLGKKVVELLNQQQGGQRPGGGEDRKPGGGP